MKKFGAVYLAITGGTAVLAARGLKKVHGVEWFELGMPEAIWIIEAEKLGPLTVAIDTHGNSMYADVDVKVKANIDKAKKKLGI